MLPLVKVLTAIGLIPLAHASPAIPVSPEPQLVSDVKFSDPALGSCVRAYSAEQGYRTVSEVKEVVCYNRGVRTLGGLEAFTEALVIDLSLNDISDFSPLYGLGERLGYLDIHGNHVACALLPILPRQLPQAGIVGLDPSTCDQDPQSPKPPVKPSEPPAEPVPPGGPGAHEYAQVAAIVSQSCGGCHGHGRHKGGVRLDSEQDLLAAGPDVVRAIQAGRMPPREPDFASSPEGQALVVYLQAASPSEPGRQPPRGGCSGGGGGDGDDFADHRHGCDD